MGFNSGFKGLITNLTLPKLPQPLLIVYLCTGHIYLTYILSFFIDLYVFYLFTHFVCLLFAIIAFDHCHISLKFYLSLLYLFFVSYLPVFTLYFLVHFMLTQLLYICLFVLCIFIYVFNSYFFSLLNFGLTFIVDLFYMYF